MPGYTGKLLLSSEERSKETFPQGEIGGLRPFFGQNFIIFLISLREILFRTILICIFVSKYWVASAVIDEIFRPLEVKSITIVPEGLN